MKRMKELNETLFKAICLCFSACMLVLSLLTTIDAAAQREQQTRLRREIETLSAENESLRSRVEAELSLEEIERYAREELGMQPCGPGQIVYLQAPLS